MKQIIDSRGYVGGERNRTLTPEQVVWARTMSHERRASAGEIRDALTRVGIYMSVDSVRRMLRGETYSNVGVQLPRTDLTPPGAEPVELVKVSDEEIAASAERLQGLLAQTQSERPADPAEIMRKLADGMAQAKAGSADGMLNELKAGGDPFGEDTP